MIRKDTTVNEFVSNEFNANKINLAELGRM